MIPYDLKEKIHKLEELQCIRWRFDDFLNDESDRIVKEVTGYKEEDECFSGFSIMANTYMRGGDIPEKLEMHTEEINPYIEMEAIDEDGDSFSLYFYVNKEDKRTEDSLNKALIKISDNVRKLREYLLHDEYINRIRSLCKSMDSEISRLEKEVKEGFSKFIKPS